MNFRYRSHSEFVKNWSKSRTASLSAGQVELLFEKALQKLWNHARTSINKVLLASVLDRVFTISVAKFDFLSSIEIHEEGPDFAKFREAAASVDKEQLDLAMQLVLRELIAILGNLTNEVLVVGLYDQLSKVNVSSQLKISKPKDGA